MYSSIGQEDWIWECKFFLFSLLDLMKFQTKYLQNCSWKWQSFSKVCTIIQEGQGSPKREMGWLALTGSKTYYKLCYLKFMHMRKQHL